MPFQRSFVRLAGAVWLLSSVCGIAEAAPSSHQTSEIDKRATCTTGFSFAGACIAECPRHTFADRAARKCTWCIDDDARSCTATQATACSLLFLNRGACVAASACPTGTWADIDIHACSPCTKKDPLAATCNGWRSLTCKRGHLGVDPATTCVANCPARSYLDASNKKCVKCEDEDASVCTATEAQKCTFRYLYQGSCLKTCPSGFYAAWSQRQCLTCFSKFENSLTCSSTAPITCSGDLVVVNRACVAAQPTVPTCSASQYLNVQDNVCVDCSTFDPDAATCTSAGVSSCATVSLRNGQCLAACKTDEYLSTRLQICVRCSELDPDAATCDETTGVKTCKTLTLTAAGRCSPVCLTTDYFDSAANTCVHCSIFGGGVATCSNTGIETCVGNFYLFEGFCRQVFSRYLDLRFDGTDLENTVSGTTEAGCAASTTPHRPPNNGVSTWVVADKKCKVVSGGPSNAKGYLTISATRGCSIGTLPNIATVCNDVFYIGDSCKVVGTDADCPLPTCPTNTVYYNTASASCAPCTDFGSLAITCDAQGALSCRENSDVVNRKCFYIMSFFSGLAPSNGGGTLNAFDIETAAYWIGKLQYGAPYGFYQGPFVTGVIKTVEIFYAIPNVDLVTADTSTFIAKGSCTSNRDPVELMVANGRPAPPCVQYYVNEFRKFGDPFA